MVTKKLSTTGRGLEANYLGLEDILKGRRKTLKLGMAIFRGAHNRRRAKILFVLYRYEAIFTRGKGLTSNELAELVGLKAVNICEALGRLVKWHEVSMGLTPPGTHRMRIYTITMKGSNWLHRWAMIIPWAEYGWDAEKLAYIDKTLAEMVVCRGYQ